MRTKTRWLGPLTREKRPDTVQTTTPEEWLVENKDDLVYCTALSAIVHSRHCRSYVKGNDNEYVERRIFTYCSKCQYALNKG